LVSLQQLRCYLATLEHGSFTAAAEHLGYAQPSVSEQVRQLEAELGTPLFQRAGRGVVPTEAAFAMRPHAEQALMATDRAVRAAASVHLVRTGTIRFGVFGTARLYLGSELAADVLRRYPGVRLELIGQNSAEVLEELRRGRLEAGVIALPIADDNLVVRPVMRDELVYVSADPTRLRGPMTAQRLAEATLVLSEVSWGDEDSSRRQLARAVQAAGRTLRPRVEVEDVETALEIAGQGLADTVTSRGVLHRLGDRLAPELGWVSLRPRLYDTFAIVHRRGAAPSPASQAVIDLAVERMRGLDLAITGGAGLL
jgi:DNA-binding transcriptional LysR family regulator